MEAWTLQIYSDLNLAASNLSIGMATEAIGALWRCVGHVQELMEAHGGALECQWQQIFHRSVDMYLASMNLV